MNTQPSRAEIVIMTGGAVTLASSLLAFYDFTGTTFNAWDQGLFPIATYAPLAGLLSGGMLAVRRFTAARVPTSVGGLRWEQVHLLLGILAALIMGGYLVQSRSGYSLGIGFWGMLGGSVALVVGALMLPHERHGPRGIV